MHDPQVYANSRAYALEEASKARAANHRGEGSARYWQRYMADIRWIYYGDRRKFLERCFGLQASLKGGGA